MNKLCTSTFFPVGITVDYTRPHDPIAFHGHPLETWWRRYESAMGHWVLHEPVIFMCVMVLSFTWITLVGMWGFLSSYSITYALICAPHLIPRWDAKIRPSLTKRLVRGPRWHWIVTDIDTKDWMLPGMDNEVLTYHATGEIAEYLQQIRIVPMKGTTEKLWEAHFQFAHIPTTGQLKLSWR